MQFNSVTQGKGEPVKNKKLIFYWLQLKGRNDCLTKTQDYAKL